MLPLHHRRRIGKRILLKVFLEKVAKYSLPMKTINSHMGEKLRHLYIAFGLGIFMLEDVLTSENPLMRYLTASKINNEKPYAKRAQKTMRKHKLKAGIHLQQWLRQDISVLTGKKIPYVVRFSDLYGVLTVSNRHSLFLVDEINYLRELAPDELQLLPYLGAMYGLRYMKQQDIESTAYKDIRESFKGMTLSSWLPHADYAYYAWNVGGYSEREHIFLDKTSDSLPFLISFLGHEAGHYFGSRSKTSEEYNCIEETFCDQFAQEYSRYFKKIRAGSYASEFLSPKKSSSVPSLITTVEQLLSAKKKEEAEKLLQQQGLNQASLVQMKRYSCDEALQKNVAQLFSLYGAKSILLLSQISTKKKLDAFVADAAKGISFSEIQKR